MTAYVAPAWDAPLDVEAYTAAMPPGALIKGLFPAAALAEAKKRNLVLKNAADKYLPFLDYSLVHHNRLIVEAAGAFWPELPLRSGLRKIGRAAVQSLLVTTFGKTVLAGLTQPETVARALLALSRSFGTTLSKPAPVSELVETGERSAVLRMRDAWIFLDCQQIGIIEGLCKACGMRAEVSLVMDGPSTAEFTCRWELPSGRESGREAGREAGRESHGPRDPHGQHD
jgi:uncharacterized protein (TIGR02265 family)